MLPPEPLTLASWSPKKQSRPPTRNAPSLISTLHPTNQGWTYTSGLYWSDISLALGPQSSQLLLDAVDLALHVDQCGTGNKDSFQSVQISSCRHY